jgi:hypothetical protein
MKTCLRVGSRVNCANQTEDPVSLQHVLRSTLTNQSEFPVGTELQDNERERRPTPMERSQSGKLRDVWNACDGL